MVGARQVFALHWRVLGAMRHFREALVDIAGALTSRRLFPALIANAGVGGAFLDARSVTAKLSSCRVAVLVGTSAVDPVVTTRADAVVSARRVLTSSAVLTSQACTSESSAFVDVTRAGGTLRKD